MVYILTADVYMMALSGACPGSPRQAVGTLCARVPGLQSEGQRDAGPVAGSMLSQQLSLFLAVCGEGGVLDNINMAVGGFLMP